MFGAGYLALRRNIDDGSVERVDVSDGVTVKHPLIGRYKLLG